MHPDELRLRNELAACYRIFHHLGWTELIYNHITVRLPESVSGGERHFLINPFGLCFNEVTASNLVKIDLQGRVVGESAHPVNPAGFMLHSAIHGGVAGAHCVMHTHTTAGSAVACAAAGLSTDNFYAAMLHGRVAYHDFEGITVHADEGPRVVRSIGNAQAVILRNHGLLSWGAHIAQALAYLWTLQRACEIQVAGAALGSTVPVPEAVQRKASADALQFDLRYGGGRDVFDALVRQVDRIDPSYRDLD
ncbi:class II aldolase/adducin family protein [uncultured Azohydromonas sp.]|jgi:Ribulose-5-phosphate 4-epimerase and related epimerases and aldolases|uniref:class II aldolase/adducin family protein n=1 Tax=uncultured Azohydromonas sp. TaxID=487342 RepID=UPI00261D6BA7|nr:class II aldolase/adducin family protein [uncultured Azohydromonas sp.]